MLIILLFKNYFSLSFEKVHSVVNMYYFGNICHAQKFLFTIKINVMIMTIGHLLKVETLVPSLGLRWRKHQTRGAEMMKSDEHFGLSPPENIHQSTILILFESA